MAFRHYIFMMILAKIMNINMAWVPIASMSNVGGIATARAVTAAFEKMDAPRHRIGHFEYGHGYFLE